MIKLITIITVLQLEKEYIYSVKQQEKINYGKKHRNNHH